MNKKTTKKTPTAKPIAASTGFWLVKSEPTVYPFSQLVLDERTRWDGIRSFEARNNLRLMKKGDLALFYHSNVGKEVVAIVTIIKEAYADPTSDEDWSAVDLAPVKALASPVTLATIKKTPKLSKMGLITRSRLSVVAVTKAEFDQVLRLGGTKL